MVLGGQDRSSGVWVSPVNNLMTGNKSPTNDLITLLTRGILFVSLFFFKLWSDGVFIVGAEMTANE